MKKMLFPLSVAFSANLFAAPLTPTMWADVPDVAPLRVGDTYYMVSTTMHYNPGVPVMSSTNLVDWTTISYCYQTIEDRPKDRLENGENDYMFGTWASSIRYNEADGYFYVTSFNNKVNATYLFRSKDPTKSDWEFFRLFPKQYDESLWIENGRFWVYATVPGRPYRVRLTEMKSDFSGFVDGGRIVLDNVTDCAGGSGLGEGTQVFKHDGYYYLVNIGWPKDSCRSVIVHRSKNMDGPWEGKIVFETEGIAQGSFIDRPDGSWVAVLFGDRGGVGRVPFVLETKWIDGWPIPQKADAFAGRGIPGCVSSDDFESEKLKLEWQWNHNPDNANWALQDGKLKLTSSRVDESLWSVRNQLTQRTFGPTSVAEVTVDGSNLKVGDKAGLSIFQHHYGAISLRRTEKGYEIVLDHNNLPIHLRHTDRPVRNIRSSEAVVRPIGNVNRVHFRAVCDFTPVENPTYEKIPHATDAGRFYYSLDGKNWEALGDAMYLPYTLGHFIGYRFGLFNWSTKEAGGTATFDDYRVRFAEDHEKLTMDGSNPIVKTRFSPDPAGYVDGEWFYLFTGRDDATAQGYKMYDWCVSRTKDMRNWEDFGPVLNCARVFPWARADKAWASQAIRRGDKWYWYVAVSDKGGEGRRAGDCVAVAVADNPWGPWKDALGKGLVYGWAYIDPSVFVDEDGSAWLFWGNCGGDPGCWYAELNADMVSLKSDVKPVPGLMDASAFGEPLVKRRGAGRRRDGSKNTNFEEAPWIYRLGDTYYLEYAAGGVPENWSYSTAKSIHGPWTYRGKVMDNAGGTGTIHGGSVFFKGDWYMVYHNGKLPGGADCRRSACIERYTRGADGSIPFIRPTVEGVKEAPKAASATITLDATKDGPAVPKTLYGIFYEDINYAADGGIYPELVANRGFDWETGALRGWENDFRGDGQARITLESGRPVHEATARHVRIEAFGAGQGAGVGLKNRGYHGMYVEAGKKYDLSFYARGLDGYAGGIRVVLENGAKTLAECKVANAEMSIGAPKGDAFFPALPEWKRYTAVFTPTETTRTATLSILMDAPGFVEFEQVSLFPQDTYNGRKNGLRKDLVEKLKALKPGIMRFPGGCVTEGRDWTLWYDWKLSVGDGSLESRKCIWNTWDYWQTMGLGYFEYFCLCEDLGCEPLPVMAAGITCQFARPWDAAPMESMPYFIQNYLDLIEFANGDVKTKYGALRAKMGHPAPFNLKYLGIGNENWDDAFLDRYEAIAKAIREKHPEIRLVSSAGPAPDGKSFSYAWTRLTSEVADVVDEHYYKPPQWFRSQGRRYDNYDRSGKKPNVYAGEYACHVPGQKNNLLSALCEAGVMTGFERNCDVVEMTSYAPLFGKVDSFKWKPDLIWFDNVASVCTPNYYVQQLFGVNRPDVIVPSKLDVADPTVVRDLKGDLALQTWRTSAEFADLRVTDGAGKVVLDGIADLAACAKEKDGAWELADGVLRQTRTDKTDTALTLPCGAVGDATVSFRFRRTGGEEGFLLRFRTKKGGYLVLNVGGWKNTAHAYEAKNMSVDVPHQVAGSLADNRWYDVKLVLKGETAEAFLDGQPLLGKATLAEKAQADFFEVAGYDRAAGEYVVKCVNLAAEKRPLVVDFGLELPAGTYRRIVLAGDPELENDLAHPDRCVPTETDAAFAGGRTLALELEPNSLTVLRVKGAR